MNIRIQYKGVFNLQHLVGKLKDYFEDKEFDFAETKVKTEKDECESECVFEQKTTKYVKCEGGIELHGWGDPITKDPKGDWKGRIQINFSWETIKDYEERFKSKKHGTMKELFDKLRKKDIESFEKQHAEVVIGADVMLKKEIGMDV